MSLRNGEFIICRGTRLLFTWDWSVRRPYAEGRGSANRWFYVTVGGAGLHVSLIHVPRRDLP